MFLLLVPFALALVVLSVLGLAGLGPLTDTRRADRDGLLGAVGPAVGLLMGIGLLGLAVVATLVTVGVGGDERSEEDPDDRGAAVATTTTGTPTSTTTATTRVPARRVARPAVALGPNVRIEPGAGTSFPQSYDVADGLRPDTVLQFDAHGFEPFGRAIAEQCGLVTAVVLCFNPIPVQLDADGDAHFQYLVTVDFANGRPPRGRCRVGATRCTVVVREVEGERQGEIQTVFGDRVAPPGRITVTPASGLDLGGERVTVAVRDYPPGVTVTAMLCAAPAAAGPRCGAPGPTAPLVVGRDGTGTTELAIRPGPVGRVGAPCSRGDECGISVASDDVFARAPVVPITFAAPPGAAYDPTRLALGLALAAVLAAIVAGLIFRSDWSAVGEAAAPEIDNAEYADLDAIIAALPPEEDELVPTR